MEFLGTHKSRVNRYIMYREMKISITEDFLLERMQVKRKWSNIF